MKLQWVIVLLTVFIDRAMSQACTALEVRDVRLVTSGRTVSVQCFAVLDTPDTMFFVLGVAKYNKDSFNFQVLRDEPVNYNGCNHVDVALKISWDTLLKHNNVSCCISCGSGNHICEVLKCPVAMSPPAKPVYHPGDLDLVEGKKLQVECSVVLNASSWLEFRLRDNKTQVDTVYTQANKTVKLLESIDEKGPCPVTKVRSQLTLDLTADMSGHTPSCCRMSESRRDEACTPGTALEVLCAEKGPSKFEIGFDKGPNILYAEKYMYVECEAYVGSNKDISFKWSHVISGKGNENKEYTVDNDGVKIVKADQSAAKRCKLTKLTASLNVSITEDRAGQTVSCCVKNEAAPEKCLTSPIVAVEYPPHRPELEVFYHEESGAVYFGKQLTASCKARIGTDGSLSWVLFKKNDTTVWTIDFNGHLVSSDKLQGVDITHAPALVAKGENPVLNSTVTLMVTEALQGATLACYAYMVTEKNVSADLADSYRRISLSFLATFGQENLSGAAEGGLINNVLASKGGFLGTMVTLLAIVAAVIVAFSVIGISIAFVVMKKSTPGINKESVKSSIQGSESDSGTYTSETSSVGTEVPSDFITSDHSETTEENTSAPSDTSADQS